MNKEHKARPKADISTTVEDTSVRQPCTKPHVIGSCRSFKEGQWLIRKWAKENGGETDFVKFKNGVDIDKFKHSKFYRIKKGRVENLNSKYDKSFTTKYYDLRMVLQFRPATKSEIQKYAEMIIGL